MRILSFIILTSIFTGVYAQSPHGADFKINCSDCHQTESWKVNPDSIYFDHNKQTSFNLKGQHLTTVCRNCHSNLVFNQAQENCFSCHRDIHQNSVGQDCERCHTPDTWIVKDITGFHQNSRFPLVGAHLSSDCIQCHSQYNNLIFEPLSIDCLSCHSADYFSTVSPNHAAAGFSTDCSECHNISDAFWSSGNFNHDFFPLTGGHNISNCFLCHQQGGNYSGLSSECYSCHRNDYESVQDPNHLASGFSTVCSLCHTIQAWIPGSFDHSTSDFPLTGAHISINCLSCHSQGFSGTPTSCYSCHNSAYMSTINPNHSAAGISTECQDCHNTTLWIPSAFDHISTGFELTGKHIPLQCSSCHIGTTAGLIGDCYSCHLEDYNAAENHLAQAYPTVCTMCHTTAGWEGTNFDHQLTGFPLTGMHLTAACSGCHQTVFSGTTTVCSDCHQSSYNNSTNPSHTALALSTECGTCHSTEAGWKPALFPIHNNFYELLGAHALISADCFSCHNGNYNSTPSVCFGCHAAEYNSTLNPVHSTAGFNTECSTCHSQDAWVPSTFDHDNQYFPIYSGKHSGVWTLCRDCHTVPSDFSVFSCIDCHEHNRTETDDKHTEVTGYTYLSSACYSCHPAGTAEGGRPFRDRDF